jgi:adenylyl cyclase-associated protein
LLTFDILLTYFFLYFSNFSCNQSGAIEKQLALVLEIVDMSGKCKKPAADFTAAVVARFAEPRKTIDSQAGPKASMPYPDLAKGCVEGSGSFLWPVMPTAPADTIQNGIESSEFYHNKLRKWGKENSKPEFGAFANAYRDLLKAMEEWAKDNAKMGLTWNAKGVEVKDYKPIGGSSAPPPATSPLPVPSVAPVVAAAPVAAPTAVETSVAPSRGGPAAGALAGLFSQISSIDQSSGKTEGLRHVTKDMKSSALKADGAAPVALTPKTAPVAAPKAPVGGIKMGDPKTALKDGMRWEVEFHTKDSQKGEILKITDASLKQEIYIYGCRDVVIDVTTKVKGVRIDQCTNVTVLLSAALSGVEVVNSKRMKIQVREKLPSVAIDKTDGIVVGLTWAARDAVITSSKSSEMNVTFPVSEAADADWIEKPIPEQFVSKITDKNTVHTGVSELYSS